MNPDDGAAQNVRLFNALSASYDRMGFLSLTALYLAERFGSSPGEALLDVMTGTGTLALALVDAVGVGGRVVGADLSPGMLEMARSKAAGHLQLSFVEADATALPFADAEFDGVVCASGLFFVADMDAALREWRRVLRPGGRVAFSTFGKGMMGDLPGRWRKSMGGVEANPKFPPLPLARLTSPDAAAQLLRDAGFEEVTTELVELPYLIPTPQDRWDDIEAGMEGAMLASMPSEMHRQLRDRHLVELEALFAGQPLTVPIPVLVAAGVRTG